jgi:hypothetical protein
MNLRKLKRANVAGLLATVRINLRVPAGMTREQAYRALRSLTKNGRIVWPAASLGEQNDR